MGSFFTVDLLVAEAKSVGDCVTMSGHRCVVVDPRWFNDHVVGALPCGYRFYSPDLKMTNMALTCNDGSTYHICSGYDGGVWPEPFKKAIQEAVGGKQ